MDAFRRVEIDAAVDARHPPMVLVFDERRVAPTDHFDGQCVGASLHKRRQIKFRRRAGVFCETDLAAVQIDKKATFNAAEMNDDAAILPFFWKRKRRAIQSRGIFGGNMRRIIWKRHDDIRVPRLVKALRRPVAGHGDVVPSVRFDGWFHKRLAFNRLWIIDEFEFPIAVKGHDPWGVLRIARAGEFSGRIRMESRMGGKSVDATDFRCFPRLGIECKGFWHGVVLLIKAQ